MVCQSSGRQTHNRSSNKCRLRAKGIQMQPAQQSPSNTLCLNGEASVGFRTGALCWDSTQKTLYYFLGKKTNHSKA